MNILYASDDGFARIMSISIATLLKKHMEDEINIFIITSNISEKYIKVIEGLFNNPKHNIFWVSMPEIDIPLETDRGSLAQYGRLFFDRLIPENIQRLIYLDCDTLIEENLRELWVTDLGENTIGIARDAFSDRYKKLLGLEKNSELFNSGVMIIDRGSWNEKRIEDKIIDLLTEKRGRISQGDQGVIDVIFQNDAKILDPKWNSMSSYFDFTYDDFIKYRQVKEFYSKQLILEAIQKPAIVHFTSSFLNNRPWIFGSTHRYKNHWRRVELELYDNNQTLNPKSLFLKHLYNRLPNKLAISFFGFLQGSLRPVVKRIKG
ncbi:glycosyltransferase family 8 protein [Latilactobacillus sakei]|uniref:glycosyltransferase family 8 protein n=1 Tax=Latilactobacillus sakei TaxID=1599 RepID=UPI00077C641D|nr:glycosyltransferase family 8 protein [Latilactobacillus sakei]ASN13124.1 hypothetical protein B4V05_07875 [Latilactobacillus sakei]AWZ42001.1 glycosyltransferase family 8 protein [Latilactobacillus sakei]MDM5043638.1 glycosyltransferase family 8 protein [Latilactobacillus sakei]QGL60141.1 hypothetical protein GJ664_01800 [Latilactobacillus sakei]USS38330.1 glycosyltransferase family 8 protein [Latilactobacillus sakei]